jgi:hypothetical protein
MLQNPTIFLFPIFALSRFRDKFINKFSQIQCSKPLYCTVANVKNVSRILVCVVIVFFLCNFLALVTNVLEVRLVFPLVVIYILKGRDNSLQGDELEPFYFSINKSQH